MADDDYVTKKDFVTLTQNVAIQNAKDVTKPLVDHQKKNDLKELEKSMEERALFQDIASSLSGLKESLVDGLVNGLKSLIPKTDGGLSKLLGLGLGLLLAPFVAFISFLGQLGRELKFFTKGGSTEFFTTIKDGIKNFFTKIFDKLKTSKLGKFITGIVDKLKNNKIFKAISGLFKKVFGGGKGFFSKLANIFKSIVKFATGGPFKAIMKVAGSIGRILGKLFLPITILMSVFDFVKGFMKGYEEGGILEGIKQGIIGVFDGLVGSLLRLLGGALAWLLDLLGLENLSAAIMPAINNLLDGIVGVFGGLWDVVKGIFTLDGDVIMGGLQSIWDGIVKIVMYPFTLIGALVKDIFGGTAILKAQLMLKKIGLSIASFFLFLQEAMLGLINKAMSAVPALLRPQGLIDMVDNLTAGTKIAKKEVDATIKFIEKQEKAIEKEVQLKKLEAEKAEKAAKATASGNVGGGLIGPSGAGGGGTVVNNVTYNVNGSNANTNGALGFARS